MRVVQIMTPEGLVTHVFIGAALMPCPDEDQFQWKNSSAVKSSEILPQLFVATVPLRRVLKTKK